MGDKVSSNESSVENISIKHRPMNINDDYGTFQSSEWLDAKTFLDEHLETSSTQDKIGLLSEMLQVCYSRYIFSHYPSCAIFVPY